MFRDAALRRWRVDRENGELKHARIRRVVQVAKCVGEFLPVDAFRGLQASRWLVRIGPGSYPRGLRTVQDLRTGTRDAVLARYGGGREPLPDAILFTDDYMADGALTAFSSLGVRIPEDVRLATLSHVGTCPSYVRPLTRMEFDPFLCGERVCEQVCAWLSGGSFPCGYRFSPVFIPGETF